MQIYYLDSSAVVKLYVQETSSQWMLQLVANRENSCFTSQLTRIEVVSALWRRHREGDVDFQALQEMLAAFLSDWQNRFEIIALTDDIAQRAETLIAAHPLRAYDMIHLASAVSLRDRVLRIAPVIIRFVSADVRLCQAASIEGLTVDNPAQYP